MQDYGIKDLINTISTQSGVFGIFANPGFGTTTLLMQISASIVDKTNDTVVVFSMGLSKEHWYQRMLGKRLSTDGVEVIDSVGLSGDDIESAIKNFKNTRLVIIDYLQLLENGVCQKLPRISEKYSVPILLCGKLGRNSGDFDENKTPELISVFYYQSPRCFLPLEQYDFLALLHRKHDCDRGIGFAHRYNISNTTELIIKINRFGEVGRIFFEWDDKRKCFDI